MGDEGKKIDKQLLMHIFGVAKKGGMNSELLDEMLDVVREQHEIVERDVERQTAAMSPNVPYDMQFIRSQMGTNQPQGSNAALFTKMLEDSFRAGWKADDEWDCFVEVEAFDELSTDEIDQAVKLIQTEADTQEVPVRLYANGYRCIAYPGGEWVDALTQWHEAKLAARSQAKIANFAMSPMNFVKNYIQADADATLKMHVLKHRAVKEGEEPEHFFKGLRDFLGDD